ncbi:hypothetical protein [Streptomonospora nanhaiensis]|uniref:hypothetical protein n=1 Tax=Streptomonospora nanhaiensis TaxID=1323731 RepID=UPI001C38BD83|nr:hypothetical protein [Streptomonospora nanhaiensis]MBV2363518.1 hypothetical protein [Streptomonospora nanhaiensis]
MGRVHLAGMRLTPDPGDSTSSAPVVVPHLVLDVHEDGTLTATLNHHPVAAPEDVGAWRRAMFAQIIDHVTHDRAIPVRVTVHEVDGSTFTDILPAKRPVPKPDPEPQLEPVKKVGRRRRGGAPIRVDGGDGFISGEDVAVALIVDHTDATPDGRARALLDPAVVAAAKAGEVVLVGRVSGTIAVRGVS